MKNIRKILLITTTLFLTSHIAFASQKLNPIFVYEYNKLNSNATTDTYKKINNGDAPTIQHFINTFQHQSAKPVYGIPIYVVTVGVNGFGGALLLLIPSNVQMYISTIPTPIYNTNYGSTTNNIYNNFNNGYSISSGYYQTSNPVGSDNYGPVSTNSYQTSSTSSSKSGNGQITYTTTIITHYTKNYYQIAPAPIYQTNSNNITNTYYDNFTNGYNSNGGYTQAKTQKLGATYGNDVQTKSRNSYTTIKVYGDQVVYTTTVTTTINNNYYQTGYKTITLNTTSFRRSNTPAPSILSLQTKTTKTNTNNIIKSAKSPVSYKLQLDKNAKPYSISINQQYHYAITYRNVSKGICDEFLSLLGKSTNIKSINVNNNEYLIGLTSCTKNNNSIILQY